MHEILRNLQPGSRVLDVGALTGSFPLDCCPNALVVRVDLEWPGGPCEGFVQADAAHLPFRSGSFDAVIANHSFEHIHGFGEALIEIGRVVMPSGCLYAAVPDASTFSDILFRWIYGSASGHVNPFCSAGELSADITAATGLTLTAARPLYSSFEYLNRYYFGKRAPWRLLLLGKGNRKFIVALSYAVRLFDRVFRTRLSAYGWAFYFGELKEALDWQSRINVCSGCGAGHDLPWLMMLNLIQRRWLFFRTYTCPGCGSRNFCTPESAGAHTVRTTAATVRRGPSSMISA